MTERITITPVSDEQEETSHYIAVKQDIVERRCAENALQEAEDYTNNIIRSMIDMLVVVAPDRAITQVNQVTCACLGYSEEELIGRST